MEKCSWDESWSSPRPPKPLNEAVFPCRPLRPGDAKEECRDWGLANRGRPRGPLGVKEALFVGDALGSRGCSERRRVPIWDRTAAARMGGVGNEWGVWGLWCIPGSAGGPLSPTLAAWAQASQEGHGRAGRWLGASWERFLRQNRCVQRHPHSCPVPAPNPLWPPPSLRVP